MSDIDKINLNNTVYDIVSKIAKGIVRITIDSSMISLETGFVRVMVIQDYVSENDGSCIICSLDSAVNLSSYVGNSFKFCTGISSTTPGVIDYHEKPVNLSNNKSSDLIASIWNKEREFIFVFSTEQDAWVMQLGNSEIGDAYSSHAEGYNTEATGNSAHAEGQYTRAIGQSSHAEGRFTTASSDGSHAEGYYTKASSSDQHVSGKYNIEDTNDTYVEIIGNGTDANNRSNARTLDWNGNEWIAGGFKCSGMEASSSAVKLINPQKWRDAIFDATPDGSAKDRVLSRVYKEGANIRVLEYGGYFGGSQNKRLKITCPQVAYGKFLIFVHLEADVTVHDYEIFGALNGDGTAYSKAHYGRTTPSWTNMVGTASTGTLTWGVTGTQIYSSIFAPYGSWYVKIIMSIGSNNDDIPNVYMTNES